jgi:hypothetical protein
VTEKIMTMTVQKRRMTVSLEIESEVPPSVLRKATLRLPPHQFKHVGGDRRIEASKEARTGLVKRTRYLELNHVNVIRASAKPRTLKRKKGRAKRAA